MRKICFRIFMIWSLITIAEGKRILHYQKLQAWLTEVEKSSPG